MQREQVGRNIYHNNAGRDPGREILLGQRLESLARRVTFSYFMIILISSFLWLIPIPLFWSTLNFFS